MSKAKLGVVFILLHETKRVLAEYLKRMKFHMLPSKRYKKTEMEINNCNAN